MSRHGRSVLLMFVMFVMSCSNSEKGGKGDGGGVCANDSQCAAPTPACEPQSGVCVACLPSDDHCPGGTWCSASFQCVSACQIDADCGKGDAGANVQCCQGQCVDITRDGRNCGACGVSCAGACSS